MMTTVPFLGATPHPLPLRIGSMQSSLEEQAYPSLSNLRWHGGLSDAGPQTHLCTHVCVCVCVCVCVSVCKEGERLI